MPVRELYQNQRNFKLLYNLATINLAKIISLIWLNYKK